MVEEDMVASGPRNISITTKPVGASVAESSPNFLHPMRIPRENNKSLRSKDLRKKGLRKILDENT